LLDQLKGFDEQFFYHFEEVDLCYRVWKAGKSMQFCPKAEITHLGGQSVSRSPVRFALETYRSRYRFFYKHFGEIALHRIRWVSLLNLSVRWLGYSVLAIVRPGTALRDRLACYRVLLAWNWQIDPVRFVREGAEPQLGFAPLTQPPVSPATAVS
jgi:GT2 family glycosyltransferase